LRYERQRPGRRARGFFFFPRSVLLRELGNAGRFNGVLIIGRIMAITTISRATIGITGQDITITLVRIIGTTNLSNNLG
jgi:hypothetical protein